MAKRTSATVESLQAQHAVLLDNANRFCKEVVHQIDRLVGETGATLGFPIESRVKSWASLEEKLGRTKLTLTSLTDLDDFVGIRVILLFSRELDPVIAAISSHFDVVKIRNAEERLGDDRFGYRSRHCVVKIKPQWLNVPTFAGLADFAAEIQVRTVAQHLWAATSQKLQYKREQSVPLPVRRSLSRVAALLETVDLEFERVLAERERYREAIAGKSEHFDAQSRILDVDLLEKILDEMLPPRNKVPLEKYDEVMAVLAAKNIHTEKELRAFIAAHLTPTLREEAGYVQRYRARLARGAEVTETRRVRTEQGVFFSHTGLVQKMLSEFA